MVYRGCDIPPSFRDLVTTPSACQSNLRYRPEHCRKPQFTDTQCLSTFVLTAWGPPNDFSWLLVSYGTSELNLAHKSVVSRVWCLKHSEIRRGTPLHHVVLSLAAETLRLWPTTKTIAKHSVLKAKWHCCHVSVPNNNWVAHNTELCEHVQRMAVIRLRPTFTQRGPTKPIQQWMQRIFSNQDITWFYECNRRTAIHRPKGGKGTFLIELMVAILRFINLWWWLVGLRIITQCWLTETTEASGTQSNGQTAADVWTSKCAS